MNGRPRSYHAQSCCGTCEHVFALREYDEGDSYFCHRDGSKRPLCGSVLMREAHSMQPNGASVSYQTYRARIRAWDKWATAHVVAREGYCGEYAAHKEDA